MFLYYINNTDRTADVTNNTLKINNQIQQRNDSCSFMVFQGTRPVENQDIKLYDAALVESVAANVITLQDSYQTSVNAFRAGQAIFLRIGQTNSVKAFVQSYNETTRQITLTATPSITVSNGDLVGELVFGGVIARVKDSNITILQNIEYNVTGVSYQKIFDKKIVSDTWANVDSRYIINDFVNSTVNYNSTLDNIAYASNVDIQTEWVKANDANNPTRDGADFMEADASGVFSWTFASGAARWAATPTTKNLTDFFGVSTGLPTKGMVMGWFKTVDHSKITSIKIRIGSSAADYLEVPVVLNTSITTDWQYWSINAALGTVTGTPDWAAADYAQLIINETANGSIRWNGLRVNSQNSFTLYNVSKTLSFVDLRSPQLKPSALINQLAKTWSFIWYVDYEHDIHFAKMEGEPAPYSITDTSNNFNNLKVEMDVSNLGNRVIVRGGEKTSASRYAQVIEGTGEKREWLMKNKFNNMEVTIDNGTSTDTMEVGTSSTTVKATAHGLSNNDHIVNRSRSNAVRQITYVDANTFTVEAVTGQASGDSFSKFDLVRSIGVEGITNEATVDYVGNSNEKSVRCTATEATLIAGIFIRFEYNERVPIQIQYVDSASTNNLKTLGLGDGVFDLDPITDRNIKDQFTALTFAQAKVAEFSNPVIMGTFTTDQKGLKAGQLLQITQLINRTLNDTFVIQKVARSQDEGDFKDYFLFDVTFGTTLFGFIEFMQKLLKTQDSIELNVDDIVETFVTAGEVVESDDVNTVAKGIKKALEAEIVESDDVKLLTLYTAPWHWEPSVGQPIPTRWNLAQWS